ncbi:MAG: UDP-N-acetylmuramoyl-L-alanyl-D-glutamate--2,6-diaminopimelate ligase [Clostridia bacterium]
MKLRTILNGLEELKAKGNLDEEITSIAYDSRKVKEDGVFVAIKGFNVNGHDYIAQAVQKGVKAVVVQDGEKIKKSDFNEDTVIVVAPDTRIALAKMSANFFGNPTRKLKTIGVTGTKGKTTTTYMIKEILEKAGHKVGLIGTIANYIGNEKIGDNHSRTTPESLELQEMFSKMVEQNVEIAVMEVSSQSLKLNRVYGIDFDMAIFTNFTEDHISPNEHPNMEDYFNCKLELIKNAKKSYINADDYNVAKIKTILKDKDISTFGIDNMADMLAKDVTIRNTSVDFRAKINGKNERIKVGIPSRFTVYNALAAFCVVNNFGVTIDQTREALEQIAVPGRMEMVPNKKGLNIMIDYAHSPASLESVLKAVKAYTRGRVISVFGCGGDRDTKKRPIMGEISGKNAAYTIITSDNVRTENPEDIVKQIEEGIKHTKTQYKVIVDREEAIKYAISIANKNDMIVLSGKGHENYEEINGKKYPFDERKIVQKYA